MFRGKESLNRIKLSRLVLELLNFGVSGSLRLWGVGGGWIWVGGGWIWVGGGWGVPHMHAHACVVNMIISCKWPPPLDLGKSRGFPMMSYVHARSCMHAPACACV